MHLKLKASRYKHQMEVDNQMKLKVPMQLKREFFHVYIIIYHKFNIYLLYGERMRVQLMFKNV